MNKLAKLALSICISIMSCSCTFLPGIDDEQPYETEECKLITQKLDLDLYVGFTEKELNSNLTYKKEESNQEKPKKTSSSSSGSSNSEITDALVAVILAWGTSTFIVSGSVVVTNNILHWTEYQGRCDESELQQFIYHL